MGPDLGLCICFGHGNERVVQTSDIRSPESAGCLDQSEYVKYSACVMRPVSISVASNTVLVILRAFFGFACVGNCVLQKSEQDSRAEAAL